MDRLSRFLGTVWDSIVRSTRLKSKFAHQWDVTMEFPPAAGDRHVGGEESETDSDETISEITSEDSLLFD